MQTNPHNNNNNKRGGGGGQIRPKFQQQNPRLIMNSTMKTNLRCIFVGPSVQTKTKQKLQKPHTQA